MSDDPLDPPSRRPVSDDPLDPLSRRPTSDDPLEPRSRRPTSDDPLDPLHVDPGEAPDPLHLEPTLDAHVYPATRISRAIDRVLTPLAAVSSWLWLALLGVIVMNVLLRYAFGAGRIEFEELQWHLYSVGFLVGLAAAFQADAHIRVDVLRARFSPTTRAWIELYGLLLLFAPFVALVLWASLPFVASSFAQGEVSPSPGGLPLRWAIKAVLPLGFALLALAGIARLSRVWAFLFFHESGALPEDGRDRAEVRRGAP